MTPAQYLLSVLMEECNEVAHATSKINRFTVHDSHTPGGPTNLETLILEWNDLIAVKEMVEAELRIKIEANQERIAAKKQRVLEYMSYSRLLGVVTDVQST